MRTLALDIGATKIAIGLVDGNDQILERLQVPSNTNEPIWPVLKKALKVAKNVFLGHFFNFFDTFRPFWPLSAPVFAAIFTSYR